MNRLGLSPANADKLVVNLIESDVAEVLKQALRVRKFRLRLDYTTHTPMIHIIDAQGGEHLWRILDTRKFRNMVVATDKMPEHVQGFVNHVTDALDAQGCQIIIGHRRARQTKHQEAMLLVTSVDSRHFVLSMCVVSKGSRKTIVGEL